MMLFDESFLYKLERLSVMSRRSLSGQLQGERRSLKRGQSVEFADFRPYSSGDDIRRIDWNAYARLERFFLKLFVEEEDLTVHILVDVTHSMDWGQPNKLEYAVRAAGALGYITLAGLDRLTITTLSNENIENEKSGYFAPHRGKQSVSALFGFLESYLPQKTNKPIPHKTYSNLAPILQAYAHRAKSPGPLIIISDLFETPLDSNKNQISMQQALNSLAAKGYEVTLLHILSPDEVNPDLSGELKLLDCESGAELEITADFDLMEKYRRSLSEWRTDLRKFCAARGMHYVPVATDLPLEELLFSWMRQHVVIR
ncbi:MAG: DUF58 domain-containing protein [Anaerolineales bacterium]